jgi:hypothetical protein
MSPGVVGQSHYAHLENCRCYYPFGYVLPRREMRRSVDNHHHDPLGPNIAELSICPFDRVWNPNQPTGDQSTWATETDPAPTTGHRRPEAS